MCASRKAENNAKIVVVVCDYQFQSEHINVGCYMMILL